MGMPAFSQLCKCVCVCAAEICDTDPTFYASPLLFMIIPVGCSVEVSHVQVRMLTMFLTRLKYRMCDWRLTCRQQAIIIR